ncbi:MAG TPA: TonB-dependent receptor [Candidatus Saccharimonadales bacterium]|nr:TonB-dependent receptor [Candidatus Saccharimonadales bacterium]
MKVGLKLLPGVFLATLFILMPARAQEFSGVTGVATDNSGATVVGVQVDLDNADIGYHAQTITDEQGVYRLLHVPPNSNFIITFSKEGFKKFEITGVQLGVNTVATRNAKLEIGQLAQTIEVQASGEATLNTTDATIGNVITPRQIEALPVQLRGSPAALLGLQPGVVTFGNATNRTGSVTGARADQGNITIDGIDSNDQATGQAFATTGSAPIDSVQEFRGETANILADEGRSSGAEIQIITKGGTNDFHGAAYEYHRNTLTAANSWFNNANGVPRAALIRNQFGGRLGGPIKKDKLFFFFNYEGRRDASQDNELRTVPLDTFRNGLLGYINNGAGCTSASNLLNAPQCISYTPATGANSVSGLDPAGVGANEALLAFVTQRYPEANDLSGGDKINTGFYRFNAPVRRADNIYVTRVDYNLNSKHKLFGRFNIVRDAQTDDVNSVAAQFPGDPVAAQITTRDYSFAIGHTWTISSTKINQITFGIADSRLGFPSNAQQAFPNDYTFGGGSATFIDAPYASLESQFRIVPVPTLRDDFTWTHGKHTFEFGGVFKPQHQTSTQINDFNFLTLGLGGNLTTLDPSVRPSDILGTTTAAGLWDSSFSFLLGRFASYDTNYNYTKDGTAQDPGTGKTRNYRYFEYEGYGQDQWRITNNFTLTYGLRWQFYSVPYETNGLQSVPTVDFNQVLSAREQNGPAGISGVDSAPLLQYVLGGKANNGPDVYNPDYKNFSPRLAFAYNPSFRSGLLGSVFGDRKTTIRGGASIVYDRVNANTINFIQDQISYLFNNTVNQFYGGATASAALLDNPRFQGVGVLPPIVNQAPPITTPYTPYVDDTGFPFGNADGQFNYTVEKKFRTPYSDVISLGVQRELPGNFILEVDYVGRLGRRLFAQSDASQIVDFTDPTSQQGMQAAFRAISAEVRAGVDPGSITPQPWFENQVFPGASSFLAGAVGDLFFRGDLSDTIQLLYANGLLAPNVGLGSQFSVNAYISNAASSNYHAMLTSLRKRFSNGIQFDLNYTLSHSIDNLSTVGNTVTGGLICDVRNLRVCRGNSDFDVTHFVSANGVFELPYGHGKRFGNNAPGFLNQILGGWQLGTIVTLHSGFAFSSSTDSFPVNFFVNSPGVFGGNTEAIKTHIHTDSDGVLQLFANPTAAQGAFAFPDAGSVGNRNNLRGPGFWNVDSALSKTFPLPWKEGHKIQFRWDAYNLFNHPSFADPTTNVNAGTFGQITSTVSTARVMQFSLRYEF